MCLNFVYYILLIGKYCNANILTSLRVDYNIFNNMNVIFWRIFPNSIAITIIEYYKEILPE